MPIRESDHVCVRLALLLTSVNLVFIGGRVFYYKSNVQASPPARAAFLLGQTHLNSTDAAVSQIIGCAANPQSPCVGRNMSNILLNMPADGVKQTLSSINMLWGTAWPGGWQTHASNHWDIRQFNRCGHAPSSARPNAKTRGVIFTLIKIPSLDYERWRVTAVLRFENWATMLLSTMHAPLVIFTQTEVPLEFKLEVHRIFEKTGGVTFRPARMMPDRLQHLRPTPKQPTNYTEMCLYLGFDVYQDTIFNSFDYFLRLDSDVTFEKPVTYDVFDELHAGGFLTGYAMLGMPEIWSDSHLPVMSERLLRPVFAHMLRRGILPPPDFSATGNQGLADSLWSGPLQLSSVALYRNPDFFNFVDAIDIWSLTAAHVREQAINTLWLKMAVPRDRALWLCDLDMSHKIRFMPRCGRIQC